MAMMIMEMQNFYLYLLFYLTMKILASKLFFTRDERLKSQAIMTVDTDTGDVLVNQVSFTRVELIISNQIWIVLFLSKLT